jgi:hypothetical protein
MAAKLINLPVVFGVSAPKPLNNFPHGKTRIRLRSNEFAKVYVRNPEGIREFVIQEKEGCWIPFSELARNIKK